MSIKGRYLVLPPFFLFHHLLIKEYLNVITVRPKPDTFFPGLLQGGFHKRMIIAFTNRYVSIFISFYYLSLSTLSQSLYHSSAGLSTIPAAFSAIPAAFSAISIAAASSSLFSTIATLATDSSSATLISFTPCVLRL